MDFPLTGTGSGSGGGSGGGGPILLGGVPVCTDETRPVNTYVAYDVSLGKLIVRSTEAPSGWADIEGNPVPSSLYDGALDFSVIDSGGLLAAIL